MNLKTQISALVEEKIAGSGLFLVDIRISPSKIAVIIDHPKGVRIDNCVEISRFLQQQLETSDVFEKHELEVGSPGMEEPLQVLPQYLKRIGQKVAVVTFDGLKHSGKLVSADQSGIELEEEYREKGAAKKEIQTRLLRLPFESIKETKVIFSFDKII